MRLATPVIAAVVATVGLGLGLGARPVAAEPDAPTTTSRAVIDRVDLEPASITGYRLRVQMSALSLQGQVLDLTDPKTVKLMLGSRELKAPYALGFYNTTISDTAVVVVVQATLELADVLPVILDALDQSVLAELGDRTQVALLPYGEATGTGKLMPVKAARTKISSIQQDGTASDPALLDTLERALQLLRKATSEPEGRPIRKLILVIGDGRDRASDHDRVTRVGTRAAREGVRIDSFAYAPNNIRRPLLLLGELSKRSLGTFRWVRGATAESWRPAFQQLRDEIMKQYVLTYFVSGEDDVVGKRVQMLAVGRTEARSNEAKIPDPGCGAEPCEAGYCADRCVIPLPPAGRGVVGWLLLVGGIGLGALLGISVIAFALSKRSPSRPHPGPHPGRPNVKPSGTRAAPGPRSSNAPPAAPPAVQRALLVMNGPRVGERIFLRDGFAIGKAPTSDLVIDDGYASTQHARIAIDPAGTCRLFDHGSTNGTFVNGTRIITEVVLEHGASLHLIAHHCLDVILRIGSTELMFLAQ